MESVDYQSVISDKDVRRFPVSITTTEVNLTGSWRFSKPVFKEKVSPCSVGCPVNTNIPKYIFYLLKNDMDKAIEVLRMENPFPATCGRVCPHFCQAKCNRKDYDGAVEIKQIEKFVGDYALNIPPKKAKVLYNRSVAVVGGGPAGLSCAYFLAVNGYKVDLFEKENFLGGLLVYGIPEYRLPREVVKREIENILSVGNIEVYLSSEINRDKLEELKSNYDAVFVGVGLSKDREVENIKVDNRGVFSGYELLKRLNTDLEFRERFSGERVGVIGAGNVAMDVARTLIRLGNDVEIIYRRTLEEAPSFEDEKNEALEEGVKVREKRVVENLQYDTEGRLLLKLRGIDRVENGKAALNEIKEDCVVDKLILATGQARSFEIDEDDKVFLGGDFLHGARTVIEAIASGKQAAFRIMAKFESRDFSYMDKDDRFFRAERDFDEYKVVPFERINLHYFEKQESLKIEKLPKKERVSNFREVVLKPSLEKILGEAKRCFSCGVCNECKTCWFFCPDMCIGVHDGVEFDYSFCKGCGVCSEECPRGVIDIVEDK